jgi:hypothetical protein
MCHSESCQLAALLSTDDSDFRCLIIAAVAGDDGVELPFRCREVLDCVLEIGDRFGPAAA